MNEKLTLPGLVANLAIRSGKTKKQCEDFLRELFDVIEQTLVEGESIKIKNLGTFKIIRVEPRKSVDVNTGEDIEIPGHNKVSFIPTKELAELINEPFSMFESVEIPLDDNNFEEAEDLQIDSDERTAEAEEYETEAEADDSVPTYEESPVYMINDNEDSQQTEEAISEEYTDSPEKSETHIAPAPKRFRFLFGFLTGVACSALIIGVVSLVLFRDCLINTVKDKNILPSQDSVTIIKTDSIVSSNKLSTTEILQDSVKNNIKEPASPSENHEELSVPTPASDQIVYDTISKTRYLTTMAKIHYGNFNLWPYIYIENQKILGHPDRIKPGTRVVIPSLSKYKVNPANKSDIDIAKKKGLEIYKRYQ